MLTKLILVGLIPGLLATPILPRHDATAKDAMSPTTGHSLTQVHAATDPTAVISKCSSNCDSVCKDLPLKDIKDCYQECTLVCAHDSLPPELKGIERRQHDMGGNYAARPMSTTVAKSDPSLSVGSSVHINVHTSSAPSQHAPNGYAAHTPQAQPHYPVHGPPADVHAAPSPTPKHSNAAPSGYPAHPPQYGTGRPPSHAGPASSIKVVTSVHTNVHVSSSSFPVVPMRNSEGGQYSVVPSQHAPAGGYPAHTRPADLHAAPSVTHRPSNAVPGYPSHQPHYPAQGHPSASILAASSVRTSVHVNSASSFPVVPMKSSDPGAYSVGPSRHVQPVYAVNTPPASVHAGPSATPSALNADPSYHYPAHAQPGYSSVAAQQPVHTTLAADPSYSSRHPSADPGYSTRHSPADPSYSSRHATADPTHSTPAPHQSHAPTNDPYPNGAPPSGNGACAESCSVKCQHADIAFDVTQCRTSCVSACSQGADSSVKIGSGKGHGGSPAAVGASAITYEGCMKSCRSRTQHADIAFDVSQGETHCKSACAKYASSNVGIYGKREEIVPRHKKPAPPPAPGVGVVATTWETCISDCKNKFQSADIAFDVSTGESDCKAACAQYASSGVGIIDKRENLEVRHKKPPPPPAPGVGVSAMTYEACISDCKSKFQSADIAFDVSTGQTDCKAACAQWQKSDVGIFDKRENLEVRHKKAPPPSVPGVGVDATTYEACVSACSSKYQSADIAFVVSQGESDCKAACFKKASAGAVIVDKRENLEVEHEEAPTSPSALAARHKKPPPPPAPGVGVWANTYEGCLSDCHSKFQSADIAFDVSTGKSDCKAACFKYLTAGVGIVDKREDEKLAVRSKKPKPPQGPAVGVSATKYEACLSDCHSKFQSADIAFVSATGSTDCKKACVKYLDSSVGIIDKRQESNLAVRHKKPPPPPTPGVGVVATTWETCMSDCHSKFQSADIAFVSATGSSDCKAACAKYETSAVGIIDKREEPNLAVRHKKPPPPPTPAVGVVATTWETCMSDCHSKFQSADIAFVSATGSTDCKAACAKYENSAVGLFDKKDTIPEEKKGTVDEKDVCHAGLSEGMRTPM